MTQSTAIRLLYIDDDPGIGRLVQLRLERSGYEVRLAHDGPTGIEYARNEYFDAIALDHYMPGHDGLEVLAQLQELPDVPPVIFVTGATEPHIAVAALKAGAKDYVVKDVQGKFLDLLGTTVRHAIEQRRMRLENEAAQREVRESRDRLERLAAQQAVLLKEVNHRVANSLQLICSMIELQARKVADPSAREMLRRAAERVDAVALVHRRLYTSDDISFVDMDHYLAGLIEEFRRAMETDGRERRIELQVEEIRIETDKAVSIGLIVNELVTNALKYAYPEDAGGEVRVRLLRADAGGGVDLTVEDDGVGYPEGNAPAKGSGLGAIIVAAMASTLKAKVDLDRAGQGTRFRVTIPA